MGRATRKREAQDLSRVHAFDETLRRPRAKEVICYGQIAAEVFRGHEHRATTTARWAPVLKSKDRRRLTLAAARHFFARYPVPYHLERIWSAEERLSDGEKARRRAWYVTVAGGGSLHKEHTRDFFTRSETHTFLTVPGRLTFVEALWYAVASSYTENHGLRLRICRSKIARTEVTPFWKDVARFFCVNDAPIQEINDICDYLQDRLARDAGYSLKGRTLWSLRSQMRQWHADLARIKRHGHGVWDGLDLPDWTWCADETAPPHKKVVWMARQIKTGKDLAQEGNAMRHCVYTYKRICMQGTGSIWSLRRSLHCRDARVLTIEVQNENRQIVQIRGLANRGATSEEMHVVWHWARESGLAFYRHA